ncbi:Unknown protein, partial [Striga hermonthica]
SLLLGSHSSPRVFAHHVRVLPRVLARAVSSAHCHPPGPSACAPCSYASRNHGSCGLSTCISLCSCEFLLRVPAPCETLVGCFAFVLTRLALVRHVFEPANVFLAMHAWFWPFFLPSRIVSAIGSRRARASKATSVSFLSPSNESLSSWTRHRLSIGASLSLPHRPPCASRHHGLLRPRPKSPHRPRLPRPLLPRLLRRPRMYRQSLLLGLHGSPRVFAHHICVLPRVLACAVSSARCHPTGPSACAPCSYTSRNHGSCGLSTCISLYLCEFPLRVPAVGTHQDLDMHKSRTNIQHKPMRSGTK